MLNFKRFHKIFLNNHLCIFLLLDLIVFKFYLLSISRKLFVGVAKDGFVVKVVLNKSENKPNEDDKGWPLVMKFEDQTVNDNSFPEEPFDKRLENWELIPEIWCHCTTVLNSLVFSSLITLCNSMVSHLSKQMLMLPLVEILSRELKTETQAKCHLHICCKITQKFCKKVSDCTLLACWAWRI